MNNLKKFFLALTCLALTACSTVQKENEPLSVAASPKAVESIKEKGKLTVGVKTDVPGLSFLEEDGTYTGLEVELAYKSAAKIFEVSVEDAKDKDLVEFVGVNVADREEKLEKGEVDVLFATYTITKERAEKFALSDSYYKDYIGLMVKKDNADANSLGTEAIRSIADLDGKIIGVPKKATTRTAFLNYIDTMNTIEVSPIFNEYVSYDALYKALKAGDIDVMSVDVSILNGYLDNTLTILADRFAGQNYGAATLKDNEGLLIYINAAINE